MEAEESNRPLIVGERTNVIGSRLFKKLVAEEKWEEATEIARRQVKNGAHIIDVCLQSTDRDEIEGHPAVLREADPQDQSAGHDRHHRSEGDRAGADLLPGQEHHQLDQPGGRRGEVRARLPDRASATARRWWSAPSTRTSCRRRRSRASASWRSRSAPSQLLTEKYGIPPEDIIIDPLVFPCATGDENYIGGAVETIEGIRLIKENIPYVKTVLGISNISFGLPAAAREVVNSVFLYYCTKAGLDLAIVNAEKLERFASLPEEERRLAENLLFNTPPVDAETNRCAPRRRTGAQQTAEQKVAINQFHIAAITEHFRKAGASASRQHAADLPLDQRLAQLHHRRHQGRPDRRSRPQARGRRGAARHHQRAADGRA